MSDRLPGVDSDLRRQLARRSAGQMPAGLLADVHAAVDRASEPHRGIRLPRPAWTAPRLAGAGVAVALVALLAVAAIFPALQSGSGASNAGYPADRALTTAELASILAGPALPTNTTLVVSATIDVPNEVCPMDRYETMGVIDGIDVQVCGIFELIGKRAPVTGTFAFRYLGGRLLGLLGQITPASPSKLAFRVADNWPTTGRRFLVEGWLGAVGPQDNVAISCAATPATGDVLSPSGADCPFTNWLSDDPTAPLIESKAVSGWHSSDDALSVRGHARYVEAGGMRIIDSIDHARPAYGTYVVEMSSEQCSGAAPQDSAGCPAWLVLAKMADIALPAPSSTATSAATPNPTPATTTPAATASLIPAPSGPLAPAPLGLLGSGNWPLTEIEFEALWAADRAHLAGRIAIVNGPVPAAFECSSGGAVASVGPTASPGTCHVATFGGQIGFDGHVLAVRVGADGKLSVVGDIGVPKSGYVFSLPETAGWTGRLAIVDAWLDWQPGLSCDIAPYPSGSLCSAGAVDSLLTAGALSSPWATPANQLRVQLGAYQIFGSPDLNARPIHGIYLIRTSGKTATILAQLDAVPAP
jgi:hypothetical protein